MWLFGILLSVAHAAIPPTNVTVECTERRSPEGAGALVDTPKDSPLWGCVDLSLLPKADLILLASKAPSMRIKVSETTLNPDDLIEVQKAAPITVEVDAQRFNRRDLASMRAAGIELFIIANVAGLNVGDYQDIARGDGPAATVEYANFPAMSVSNVMELATEKNLSWVLDLPKANMTEQQAEDFKNLAGSVRIRL